METAARSGKTDSNTHPPLPAIETLKIKVLSKVCNIIGKAVHLDTTINLVLQLLHDTLHMQRATLLLLDPAKQKLMIRSSYGLSIEEERRGVYKPGEGICGQVFQSGCPCIVPDINEEPLFLNRTGARSNVDKGSIAFVAVPVEVEGRRVGILTVDQLFGPEVSLKEDISFLEILSTLIGQFLQLHQAINRKSERLVEENRSLKAELHSRFNRHYIIGQSRAMQEIFQIIEKVAPSRATVLLQGESGTGKELVARALHQASPRKEGPFIEVNCAALPAHLLESELLGHDKGAFTGADSSKPGRFELADRGTIFLDEIGEMNILLQAKLLRVLQERKFERVGGTRTITVDMRIITATNIDLLAAVEKGEFRSDLFYRLNVVPIQLPPLREREGDIALLIEHFLSSSNVRNDKNVKLSPLAMEFLQNYPWPGNVRELQNLIERLVILSNNTILNPEDLASYMNYKHRMPEDPQTRQHGPASLQDMECQEIEAALKRNGWIQARAARELGITQRQIGYRIKKFGIQRPHFNIPDYN